MIIPRHPLRDILENRIAIIDGAMGTTIRTYGMTEADIRGERFKDAKKDLLNNGDLFSLTQPKMIGDISQRSGSFNGGFAVMIACFVIASVLVLICPRERAA